MVKIYSNIFPGKITGSEFWNRNGHLNDTICFLNDYYKFNFLCIPKNASNTIRKELNSKREKLFSKLNKDEQLYPIICFVRPVDDRFWSAVNTILRRKNGSTRMFLRNCDSIEKLADYIASGNDPHLASVSVLTSNIKHTDIRWYDLKVLDQLNICHPSINRNFDTLDTLKQLDIFGSKKIQSYYEKDFEIYENSKKEIENIKLKKLCHKKSLF
jgi:hypothetical protein